MAQKAKLPKSRLPDGMSGCGVDLHQLEDGYLAYVRKATGANEYYERILFAPTQTSMMKLIEVAFGRKQH